MREPREGRKNSDENRDTLVRKERIPLAKQNLVTGSGLIKEGYSGYWQNDEPGLLDAMLLAGWQFTSGDANKSHDGLSSVESPWGNVVRRVVNKGADAASRYAYLMQIPTELYQEDFAEQQASIDEKERSFDPTGRNKSLYGTGIERTRET
jgi:hypothetical protein